MTVTPSQIDKARECIRRVAWDLVDPQEFVQRPEAALGDEVHDKLELYNKCGADPGDGSLAGDLAKLALPYAPRPRTGQSEGFVQWTPKRERRVTFSMRVDWAGSTADLNGVPPLPLEVVNSFTLPGTDLYMPATVDYKTSKDPSYGVWGEEAHYQDTQSLVYAEHRLEVTGADRTYNRWLYIRTPEKKKAAAMPSDQLMERARVHAAMDRLVYPIALKLEDMKRDAQKKRLNVFDLPANARQCKKYAKRDGTGGCPRQEQCNLSPAEVMAGIEGEDRYMDDLLALLNGGAAKPASQPAAVAPVVSINPAPRVTHANLDVFSEAPMPPTPAVKVTNVADAVAVVDASIAGARPTDAQIGAVVRFLFGK